jgi:hypothetical protein
MSCYICGSDRFVDNHHYDCLHGAISPETVPLCRRCHRTYHDFGLASFSPDTTLKAIEVENRRREILRSLPVDHRYYQNLPPRALGDVMKQRSDYWFEKHNAHPWEMAAPPLPLPRAWKRLTRKVPFRLPLDPPLCGREWLSAHLGDYTPEEIEAQTIVVTCDGRELSPVAASAKKGEVKTLVRSTI